MTREEAIKLLEKSTWIVGVGMSTDITHEELESAVKFAVDCLKQPQPNPETGVVPCGCCGKTALSRKDEV